MASPKRVVDQRSFMKIKCENSWSKNADFKMKLDTSAQRNSLN